MGVKHVAVNAAFSKFSGFSNYPLLSGFGLTDLFFFGVDQATSINNLGPGADLTVTGTPTYTANSVTCTSSDRFNTSTLDTVNDTTLVGVFVPVAASSGAQVVGNFHGSLAESYGLWTANTTALNLAAGAGVDNTTSPVLSTSSMFFGAAKFSGTTKSITVGIDGELQTVSETFTRTPLSSSEVFRVSGDNYPAGVNSNVTVGAVAIHKTAVSAEAMQALYDYFRWYYAARGVAVS